MYLITYYILYIYKILFFFPQSQQHPSNKHQSYSMQIQQPQIPQTTSSSLISKLLQYKNTAIFSLSAGLALFSLYYFVKKQSQSLYGIDVDVDDGESSDDNVNVNGDSSGHGKLQIAKDSVQFKNDRLNNNKVKWKQIWIALPQYFNKYSKLPYKKIKTTKNTYIRCLSYRYKNSNIKNTHLQNRQLRSTNSIILYYPSQHQIALSDDLYQYMRQLSQCTISDVFIVDYKNVYVGQHTNDEEGREYGRKNRVKWTKNQRQIKLIAKQVLFYILKLAQKQDKYVTILGKDLGANIAIYLSTIHTHTSTSKPQTSMYRLKRLIIQNPIISLPELLTQNRLSSRSSYKNNTFLYSLWMKFYQLILNDLWETSELMQNINIPTMLIYEQKTYKKDKDAQYNNQQGIYDQSLILYSLYRGRKIVNLVKYKDKQEEVQQYKGRNKCSFYIQNITEYFIELDIFLNALS